MMAGIKFRQIPYRGSAPALNDLVAGNVDVMFDNLGSSLALVQSGKLRLLALTAPKRIAALPDVPIVAEILPGFESDTWNAIVAPPNTPKAIVDKINADIAEAMRQPQVVERFKNLSGEVMGGSAQDAAAFCGRKSARWGKLIRDGRYHRAAIGAAAASHHGLVPLQADAQHLGGLALPPVLRRENLHVACDRRSRPPRPWRGCRAGRSRRRPACRGRAAGRVVGTSQSQT